jgi:hypothetical protein
MPLDLHMNPAIPVVDLELVGGLAAPIVWVHREESGIERYKNGTVSFFDTGVAIFAVTACHVIDDCLTDVESSDFVQCMIGGDGRSLPIQLKERLVDKNSDIDLATLSISRQEVLDLGCIPLQGQQIAWPPPAAQLNHDVVLCGFPGRSRGLIAPKQIMFGRIAIGSNVSSVHDSLISLHIERDQMYRCLGDGNIAENFDFGGVSGGPVVQLSQRSGLRGWCAAGVIVDGPNPGDDLSQDAILDMEIFRARPIHFMKQNGSLDEARVRTH